MEIRINVINEMKKLRSNVYADKYTWIDELIQNTQRSGAATVNVTVTDNKVIVEDDGVGCTDPEKLFIKNISGWNETVTSNENPFGEGFFSTIVAFNHIEVESVGFNAIFDVNKMFAENNVDVVDIIPNRRKKGFKVILTDWIEGVRDYRIEYQFREVAKYIKNPKIYVNGNRVKYEGINPANIDKPFVYKVDNEYFRGWIRPHSWRCDWDNAEIKCFAFDRVVKDSSKFSGIAGVLNFKPNKIDLRSPDRKEFIFNEKYEDACNALLKEIRKMYIKVVKNGSDEQIKNYETSIDKYTSLNDYKKLIRFKFVTNKTAKAVVTDNDTNNTDNNTTNINNVYTTKKITGINDTTSLTCGISGSTESSVLSCNTNNEPLEANLHGKSGLVTIDDKNYKVVLTMKSDSATVTEGEVTSTSSPTYRKSSSGLSGGAIAGIVIACVVVLIAAAVAAIMLRKPTPPPVDNTTVSGLRTVENI